jgi:hypothetical protein
MLRGVKSVNTSGSVLAFVGKVSKLAAVMLLRVRCLGMRVPSARHPCLFHVVINK